MTAFPDHVIDPKTGLLVDKNSKHFIGIEQKPVKAEIAGEFPKWVAPHESLIVRAEGHVSVPAFPEHFIDRDGHVTVLVKDAEDEQRAVMGAEIKAAEDHGIENLPSLEG